MGRSLLWISVCMMVGVIYGFSAQPAVMSTGVSTGVSTRIVEMHPESSQLSGKDKQTLAKKVNSSIRKHAHFTLFSILGALVMLALVFGEMGNGLRWVVALGICLGVAMVDEAHQMFVPGRSGQITDVLIDLSGAGLGCIVAHMTWKLFSRKWGR